MQARLLTAIEKRQITRLGSTQPKNIDIRLICATNADIHNMVTTGKFRQDLLYRINTIEIPIPPSGNGERIFYSWPGIFSTAIAINTKKKLPAFYTRHPTKIAPIQLAG